MGRYIWIIFFAISLLYDVFLNLLGRRSFGNPIPAGLEDVYDNEKYAKWKSYRHENLTLGLAKSIVSFVVVSLMVVFNVFALIGRLTDSEYLLTLYTVIFFTVVTDIFSAVLDYISTFRIEEKYGFNKSTKKTFFVDLIKSFIIETVITAGLLLLLELLYNAIGDYIIIVFAALLLVIVMFVIFLAPYFSKIFNKFTPLENKELEERLISLLGKNGIHIKSVKVMNASLRTTKSNAYFAGFGKTKSIVLYDNLVNNFTDDEIVAVFAHEMGHAIHKDTTKNYFLSFGSIVIIVLAVWALLKIDIYSAFGFDSINYGLAFILAFFAVIPIIYPLMDLVTNWFSRKAEYKADKTAKDEGYAEQLISALKKLSRENLSDLSPDKTLVALTYSHPTLEQRINAIK